MIDNLIDYEIAKFYNQDVIDLSKHPNKKISAFYTGRNKFRYGEFSLRNIRSAVLKKELVGYLEHCFNFNFKLRTIHETYVINCILILPHISSLDIDSLKELSINDLNIAPMNQRTGFTTFLKSLFNYVNLLYDQSNGFDLDIWHIGQFNISPDRINYSKLRTTFNFTKVKNVNNKRLYKIYIHYLLTTTTLSLSVIYSKMTALNVFLEYLGKLDLTNFNRDFAVEFIEYLDKRYARINTYNNVFYSCFSFCEFLELHDYIEKNMLLPQDAKASVPYQIVEKSINKSVILQIFNCLDKIPTHLTLMFLIIYCTGMRVSEVCQLKLNSLEKRDNGYFIIYYSTKMKKEVTNIIPENLYLKLREYIDTISVPERKYLFQAETGNPYFSNTFITTFQKYINLYEIKKPDGTLYKFRPHDYRHTMGVKMRELDIPFQFIQEQLHHESPEMTLAYIEYTNREKVKKMNSYINIHGDNAPVATDIKFDDEQAYAEWAREHINAQMLPNGICARPIKLGKCPHGNSCLTCDEFRTTSKDLPSHKEHLLRTQKYLKLARDNNWVMQIHTNEAIEKNLMTIINKLEKIK